MDTDSRQAGKKFVKEAYRALFDHDFTRAIRAFEKAIQHDPLNASYYFKLSVTYMRSQNTDRALRAVEEAVRLAPDEEKYRLQYNRLRSRCVVEKVAGLLRSGPASLAVLEQLEKAIAADPLNATAHYLAGEVNFALGRYIPARRAARHALRLAPQSQEAKDLLHRCRRETIREKKRKREL